MALAAANATFFAPPPVSFVYAPTHPALAARAFDIPLPLPLPIPRVLHAAPQIVYAAPRLALPPPVQVIAAPAPVAVAVENAA